MGLVASLLERVPPGDRGAVLREAVANGAALCALVTLVDFLDQAEKEPSKAPDSLLGFDEAFRNELRATVVGKLVASPLDAALATPDLSYVFYRWGQWGDRAASRAKFAAMVSDDAQLPGLLERCLRIGAIHGSGPSQETYNLNPLALEAVMDIALEEPRVKELAGRSDLPPRQRAAAERYLIGMERVRQGKDPDGLFMEDVVGAPS